MKKIPNISARDIPSILDLDPYMTSFELLENKVENKHQFFGNKFTEHGIKYERTAIDVYEKNTENIVDDKQVNIRHPEYNWISGRVDGIIKSEKYMNEDKKKKRKINYKIIEVKCPYKYDREENNLCEQTVPKHYWVQCQVYMEMLNIDETVYVEFYIKPEASINTGKLYYTNIKRDKEWWNNECISKVQKFYDEMVKYCNNGTLEDHPVRKSEKLWKENLFN
jgi:putative phage-type endonuclease